MTLKIDRGQPPEWELELGGRWLRGPEDTRLAQVTGTLRGPDLAEPATGTVTLWPLRLPGGIVIGPAGSRWTSSPRGGRLVARRRSRTAAVPAWASPCSGRLDGRPSHGATRRAQDVKVWIAPAQLLELWLRLNF